jgi:hypothetical protein
MSTAFQELLDAAAIAKVVWIDDLFGAEAAQRVGGDIDVDAMLATLRDAGHVFTHTVGADLAADQPLAVWQERVKDYIAQNPADGSLLDEIRTAAERLDPHEYSPDSLAAIIEALGTRAIRLGFAEWQSTREQHLAEVHSVLYLVDREFIFGDTTHRHGDSIVQDLVQQSPNAMVVMLTHSVASSGVDRLRSEIAGEQDIPPHAFAVLAKSQHPDQAGVAEKELRSSIHVISVGRTCAVLSEKVQSYFSDAIGRAVKELTSQSVYDLDRAVFGSSLAEGASELDVLIRILQLRQRVHVQDALLGALTETANIVEKLRRVRALVADDLTPPAASRSPLLEWRRAEVYDQGPYINSLFSPLACGDLFAKTKEGAPAFVLLEQPCDLVVRQDGKRIACEGTLVKIAKKAADGRSRLYGIPRWNEDDELSLDFLECGSVQLRHLELVAYNDSGEAMIDGAKEPPSYLLPGWKKSYEKRRQTVRAAANGVVPSELLIMTLSERLKLGKGRLEGQRLRFPLFRVGRLRQPLATTALAALMAHRTRAAFDHDFARPLVRDEPSPPGLSPEPPSDCPDEANAGADDQKPGGSASA